MVCSLMVPSSTKLLSWVAKGIFERWVVWNGEGGVAGPVGKRKKKNVVGVGEKKKRQEQEQGQSLHARTGVTKAAGLPSMAFMKDTPSETINLFRAGWPLLPGMAFKVRTCSTGFK